MTKIPPKPKNDQITPKNLKKKYQNTPETQKIPNTLETQKMIEIPSKPKNDQNTIET